MKTPTRVRENIKRIIRKKTKESNILCLSWPDLVGDLSVKTFNTFIVEMILAGNGDMDVFDKEE